MSKHSKTDKDKGSRLRKGTMVEETKKSGSMRTIDVHLETRVDSNRNGDNSLLEGAVPECRDAHYRTH